MKIVSPLKTSLSVILERLAGRDRHNESNPVHQRYCMCGCPKQTVISRERGPAFKTEGRMSSLK